MAIIKHLNLAADCKKPPAGTCQQAAGKQEEIMRKFFLLLVLIASAGMIGCARQSNLMQPADPAAINEKVNLNEAVIVFLRRAPLKGFVGGIGAPGMMQVPIIEADKNGKLSLAAIVSANTKFQHRTTPGRHLYFIGKKEGIFGKLFNVHDEILEANLEAGKTYYVRIFANSTFGLDPIAGFMPVPINTKAFETLKGGFDYKACHWVVNTPQGQDWFKDKLPLLQKHYARVIQELEKTKPEARNVIKPEYGTDIPVR